MDHNNTHEKDVGEGEKSIPNLTVKAATEPWTVCEQAHGQQSFKQGENLCYLISALDTLFNYPGLQQLTAQLPPCDFASTLSKCFAAMGGKSVQTTRKEVIRNLLPRHAGFNASEAASARSKIVTSKTSHFTAVQDPLLFSALKAFPAGKMCDASEAFNVITENILHFAKQEANLFRALSSILTLRRDTVFSTCAKGHAKDIKKGEIQSLDALLDIHEGSVSANDLVLHTCTTQDKRTCLVCFEAEEKYSITLAHAVTLPDVFRLTVDRSDKERCRTMVQLKPDALEIKNKQGEFEAVSFIFHMGQGISGGHFDTAIRVREQGKQDKWVHIDTLMQVSIQVMTETELDDKIQWNAVSIVYKRKQGTTRSIHAATTTAPTAMTPRLQELEQKRKEHEMKAAQGKPSDAPQHNKPANKTASEDNTQGSNKDTTQAKTGASTKHASYLQAALARSQTSPLPSAPHNLQSSNAGKPSSTHSKADVGKGKGKANDKSKDGPQGKKQDHDANLYSKAKSNAGNKSQTPASKEESKNNRAKAKQVDEDGFETVTATRTLSKAQAASNRYKHRLSKRYHSAPDQHWTGWQDETKDEPPAMRLPEEPTLLSNAALQTAAMVGTGKAIMALDNDRAIDRYMRNMQQIIARITPKRSDSVNGVDINKSMAIVALLQAQHRFERKRAAPKGQRNGSNKANGVAENGPNAERAQQAAAPPPPTSKRGPERQAPQHNEDNHAAEDKQSGITAKDQDPKQAESAVAATPPQTKEKQAAEDAQPGNIEEEQKRAPLEHVATSDVSIPEACPHPPAEPSAREEKDQQGDAPDAEPPITLTQDVSQVRDKGDCNPDNESDAGSSDEDDTTSRISDRSMRRKSIAATRARENKAERAERAKRRAEEKESEQLQRKKTQAITSDAAAHAEASVSSHNLSPATGEVNHPLGDRDDTKTLVLDSTYNTDQGEGPKDTQPRQVRAHDGQALPATQSDKFSRFSDKGDQTGAILENSTEKLAEKLAENGNVHNQGTKAPQSLGKIVPAQEEEREDAPDNVPRPTCVRPALTSSQRGRAAYLLRRGFYRHARQALMNSPLLDTAKQEVREQMRMLMPEGPAQLQPFADPNCDQVNPLGSKADYEEFRRYVRGQARSSPTAGPSGMTFEHLEAIISDEQGMEAVHEIYRLLVTGRLTEEARAVLCSSKGIALDKNGQGRVRPICIGEVLMRALSGFMVKSLAGKAHKIFPRYQYGCLIPGGVETVIHKVRATISGPVEHQCNEKVGVLWVDVENAFGKIARDKVLDTVAKLSALAPLRGLIAATYLKESPIVLKDRNGDVTEVIPSSQGVRQGDPLGGLLFAATLQSALTEIATIPRVFDVNAVYDDIYITMGKLGNIEDVVAQVKAALAKLGLELNASKCRFIWPHQDQDPPEMGNSGIPLERDPFWALGTLLNSNECSTKSETLLNDLLEEQHQFGSRLVEAQLPSQGALQLLVMSMIPKMTHFARTTPPSLSVPTATAFDKIVMEVAKTTLGLPENLNDRAVQQMRLPVKMGGLGLRPVAETAPFAYFSSLVQAQSLLEKGEQDPLNFSTCSRPFRVDPVIAAFRNPVPKLKELIGEGTERPSDFAAKRTPYKLQEKLQEVMDEHRLATLNTSLNELEQHAKEEARLRISCARTREASFFFKPNQATPATPTTFAQALHQRLGLIRQPRHGRQCSTHGGTCEVVQTAEALSCRSVGHMLIHRHNLIRDELHHYLNKLGCTAIKEPQHMMLEDGRRVDILTTIAGIDFAVDVTVINPYTEAAVEKEKASVFKAPDLMCIVARERTKTSKYRDLTQQNGATFVPFVVTVDGVLGEKALEFLDRIAKVHADTAAEWQIETVHTALVSCVMKALMHGNHEVLDAHDKVLYSDEPHERV